MLALFKLRTTVFNVGCVWNTESRKLETTPGCKSTNTKGLPEMRPAAVPG